MKIVIDGLEGSLWGLWKLWPTGQKYHSEDCLALTERSSPRREPEAAATAATTPSGKAGKLSAVLRGPAASHLKARFWNRRTQLQEDRSRLCIDVQKISQRQNTHWKALAEIYEFHQFPYYYLALSFQNVDSYCLKSPFAISSKCLQNIWKYISRTQVVT